MKKVIIDKWRINKFGGNFLKKVIIGLCIVITTGLILFIVQDEFIGNENANSIDEMFSGQIFDDAQEKFTVHAMGLSPEEKVFTVRIERTQYKEQAEEYFRDILDSRDMKSYELEVFADDLTLQ
ncbi:hypothetical protein D0S48_04415 [Psychrobacillus sp. AK 1817]|nr:hypothetical protein D0S48_04415 [Psychrobacillus sp. AK 1817]